MGIPVTETPKSERRGIILVATVGVLLAAGWLLYPRVEEYLDSRPDRGDFQGNPELLVRIKSGALPAAAGAEAAQDWPQWRGPRRDGVAADAGPLAPWPTDGPRVLWRAKTGAGYSSPAVANGKIFTLVQDGDDEAVVCWDADSGQERWRHKYPAKFHNAESGTGPHATPAVDGNQLYSVGTTGLFYCLDVDTGKVLWSHDLLQEF